MRIVGFVKTSLIEWPGKISSVIFTPGCNFRCPFCHNAGLVNIDKAKRLSRIDEKQILTDLRKRKKWVEAVAITGGEPTLQAGLSKFLSKLKKKGFMIMWETNGSRPEIVTKLQGEKLVDYWAMDLKGDFTNYLKFIGVKDENIVERVKKSVRLILESGVEYEFRTTVVPGLHDLNNLKKLAKQVALPADRLKTKWFLQQFRPVNTLDKKFLELKPFPEEQMKIFQKEMQKIIPNTFLRGL